MGPVIDDSSEGYDENFDPPLERNYECSICLFGLRNAVQTPCGHRFCRNCITRSLDTSGSFCPNDQQPMKKSQLHVDNFVNKMMMDRQVFCRYKTTTGCTWKGRLGELETHLSECEFVLRDCPNDCGMNIAKREISIHATEHCIERITACRFCAIKVKWKYLQVHYDEECAQYPTKCVNCGQGNIPRCKVDEHFEHECPAIQIKCPFNVVGCEFAGLRVDVNEHVHTVMIAHLSDMIKAFRTSEQARNNEMSDIKRNISDLWGSVRASDTSPHVCKYFYMWELYDVGRLRREAIRGLTPVLHSPSFYTALENGYKFCLRINLNGVDSGKGKHVALFVHAMSGSFDHRLQWPFKGNVSLTLLDQSSQLSAPQHITETFRVRDEDLLAFHRPTVERNHKGYGFVDFVPITVLSDARYVKDDRMLIRAEFEYIRQKT
ncbi:TNF receptor-associated factor 6-like [Montipora capricornis]|uniref:TNF receptor-associated factor 6-like n=1 Tax=Montipora capricornis TaxID=246305 RepID=UPI0035F1E92F